MKKVKYINMCLHSIPLLKYLRVFFFTFWVLLLKMNYLNQFYLLIYLNCTFSIYFSLQCGVPFTEHFAQMSHISVNQFSASVLSIICTPIASVYYSSSTRACWKYISDFSEKKKILDHFMSHELTKTYLAQ